MSEEAISESDLEHSLNSEEEEEEQMGEEGDGENDADDDDDGDDEEEEEDEEAGQEYRGCRLDVMLNQLAVDEILFTLYIYIYI